MVSTHDKYAEKLRAIGKSLGYDTESFTTPLGRVDAKWCEAKLLPYLEEREQIPVVVFEVVCSEGQKELRGSLLNMLSAKPSLAVFILIREEIKKYPRGGSEPEKWLKRIENYVNKLMTEFQGVMRMEKWYEDKVDELYQTFCK